MSGPPPPEALPDAGAGPRLLWVTESYHPSRGGMAQSCDRITHGLRAAGVCVDIAHLHRRAAAPGEREVRNGRYLSCPVGEDPAHAMNLLWARLRAMDREHSHVVAYGGVLPLLAAPVYAAWLGRPLITLLRGNDLDAAVFSPRRRPVLREAVEGAARVCLVTREACERVTRLFPGSAAVWIPNGIDRERWRPLPSDRRRAAEWRASEVRPGRRVLGLFGHIKRKKGGLFLLQTLLASGRTAGFHLLFAGELEPAVAGWLEAHREQVDFTVLPFMERYDLLPYYLACDLVVLASYYDGMPNVMLEACALGVPLLASTAGGMGDVLADGRHAYLFPPGDGHAGRAAIERAAGASAGELREMGRACAEEVAGELGHQREVQAYRSVLDETAPAARAGRVQTLRHG